MKVKDAITQLDKLKPNQYDTDTKIRWLSYIDEMIVNEIINTHAREKVEFTPYEDEEHELLVKSPYDILYLHYLMSQVDFHNAEFGRYNNSSMMFNVSYQNFAAWYNRNNMPLQRSCFRKI